MATRRQVDLGTVGFGLVPDTKPLEASLRTLRQFGRQVDALAASTDEGADKLYSKFSSIERSLNSLFQRTSATTSKMRETGLAAAEIDKVNVSYQRLTNTLTKQAEVLTKNQIARGTQGMSSILGTANMGIAAKEASKLAEGFRALDRAAIIAVGPLSGVGARLAVLAALFESGSASAALFVAGTAGVITVLSLLGAASVRAVTDMQRFNAQLTAASGSSALVGEEFEYIQGQADKLGLNVRGLTESYAKFGTSARLTGQSLGTTRDIFEGAATAASAMRLNTERTNLVFLALEQMMSKGVVTMEELRRQLGDLLPGSFELAARAMGKSTAEFNRMIKAGKVLPEELLPRMAAAWKEIFGPAAAESAKSIQGEMEKFGNSIFELEKRFDSVTRFSELFRSAMVSTRGILDSISKNMEEVVAWLGAIAGAGAGLAVYRLLLMLKPAINAITVALTALRAVGIGAALASIAASGGTLLPILAALGLAAAGAAVGYRLLHKETDAVATGTEDFLKKTKEWVDIQEKLGESDRRTTREMKISVLDRMSDIQAEIDKINALVSAQLESEQKITQSAARMTMSRSGKRQLADTPGATPGADVLALRTRLAQLTALRDQLEKEMIRINNLKVGAGNTANTDELTNRERAAVQRLMEQRDNLDKQTEQEIILNRVLTGSWKDFSEQTKVVLLNLAAEIDYRHQRVDIIKAEYDAMKVLNDEEEKTRQTFGTFWSTQQESLRAQQLSNDMIGNTALEISKLTKVRDIDVATQKAAASIDAERFPAIVDAIFKAGEALKTEWIDKLNMAYQKSRLWTTGMKQGIDDYVEAATNAAQQTKDFFTNTFKNLEDSLVDFVKTGKWQWRDFANYIVDQLIRIQIQRIIAFSAGTGSSPGLLGSILGGASAFFISGGSGYGASAGVAGITGAYASGGKFFAGQDMIVGESGPELITAATGGQVIPNKQLGGGPTFYVDMRGASDKAVADLRALVLQVNGSIETRAVSAVTEARRRRPLTVGR